MTEGEEMTKSYIPEPSLRRLPWYLAQVSLLRSKGVTYVSSTALGNAINVDASRIAKDLSYLGIKGKTRIGYEVAELEKSLLSFLGFGKKHKAVMMGVGSLGAALVCDNGLERFGLDIVAGFDIDPQIAGKNIGDCAVMLPDRLKDVVRHTGAEIGIVCVPAHEAQKVADNLTDAGIRALWNFTPIRLAPHKDVVIVNTSIYAHLAVMYNRLASLES